MPIFVASVPHTGGIVGSLRTRTPIRVGVIVVAGTLLGVVVFLASRFWFTFEAVATEDFNPRAAARPSRSAPPKRSLR